MPTQALAAYGIQLRMGDGVALAPVAITAATLATPIILTTAPHGVTDVDVVTVSGVGGNTAANNTTANPIWIAARVDATHLHLRETAGNGVYTAGGTVTRNDTYATIAEVTNVQDAGIMATLVDASAHDGAGWVSRVPTLLSGSAIRLAINLVPAHPTHNNVTGLEFLLRTKARRHWLLVFPDALRTAWYFTGFVQTFRVIALVAGILTADAVLEFTDTAVLSAAA